MRRETLAGTVACVCAMALTAGIVDMMVNEASAISYNSGTNRLYQQAENMTTNNSQPLPAYQQTQQPAAYTPANSDIFACVQHGKKWQIVDGNVAGPISAPLYKTEKSCMQQVSDWSKS